ncbi:MAG: glycosyl hydrolase [Planctomycetota bacterium]
MAKKKQSTRRSKAAVGLVVGTTKGVFLLEASRSRRGWTQRAPALLGSKVFDARADPRRPEHMLATVSGGHLGPTVFRSTNRGRTWTEAKSPPRFGTSKSKKPTKRGGTRGHTVAVNFYLAPGHSDEEGTWYLGTAPQGLFRSEDGGDTWSEVEGWGHHPKWHSWTKGGADASPDGAFLHSIQVDPRDAKHLFVNLSMGGTFESLDAGASWSPLNAGVAMDFFPGEPPEFGHDPHSMVQHPGDPDRLYQQNHCGIYRLDRALGTTWRRIGERMPKSIGDIGFPMVPHPTDPERVWVFPMDGTELWPRTSKQGKPAVYATTNGGKRWQRLDAGFPERDAWWTVLRQAMCADDRARGTGLYLGTTSGEVWASRDEGQSFACIARHLPRVQSVRFVRWS